MTRAAGFTLIELIVTVALLAILGAVAAVFIRPAIEAFISVQRRAELSDVADTAMRRLSRDVRLGLPNSPRTIACGAGTCLEILLTRNGGRYRSGNDDDSPAATTEDFLDFSAADNRFDTLGALVASSPSQAIVANADRVVVHNLGIPGADAYNGDNTSLITAFASPSGSGIAGEDRITIVPKLFPVESPGRRFQVISGPVTFECVPGGLDAEGNATGSLRRWAGYPIQAAQPTAAPVGAVNVVLAGYVSGCEFQYATLALLARGLVSVRLQLTRGGETGVLYHEIHVDNTP
jgi:MSHA biogenesis protein MshO